MDEKHEAFKQSVNSLWFSHKLVQLQIGKAKITKDDGKIMQITGFDFNNPEQRIGDSTQFIYVCSYKLSNKVQARMVLSNI